LAIRAFLLLGLVALVAVLPASARDLAQKKQLARNQYQLAERLRQELNGRPLEERTRRDYQQVTDAYRRVYYTAPTSSKAELGVVAVAELLAEAGRRFNDPKMLAAAIGQYEFLRREYPGSKYRADALYTIGQIYKSDLNDPNAADAVFQDFLKHYPRSSHAEGARQALAELRQPPAEKKKEKREASAESVRPPAADPHEVAGQDAAAQDAAPAATAVPATAAAVRPEAAPAPPPRNGLLPQVTGIRYWSTPDYTRVAIDLETEVQYQAGRVPDPDRIFFDLHNTKLASVLAGKSFEVQDGFLRKIRVAQYTRNITRVVLEVDDLSDYSAFLLPNPYRLIIDIHGRAGNTLRAARKPAEKDTTVAAASKPAPAVKPPAEATTPPATRTEAALNRPAERPRTEAPSPRTVTTPPAPATKPSTLSVEERRQQLSARAADGTTAPLKPQLDEAWAASPAAQAPPSSTPHPDEMANAAPPAPVVAAPAASNSETAPAESAPWTSTSSAAAAAPAAETPVSAPASTTTTASVTPLASTRSASARGAAPLPPPGSAGSEAAPSSAPTYESVAPRTTVAKRTIPGPDRTAVPAQPTSSGERSLTRALGLKVGRIVIDAGHGGHDTGTVGPGGLQEKDLVLDVALRLGKLLTSRMGASVIYTREDDTFVPLETRTAIANQNEADLFISIHANSSSDPSVRGIETYYLNFTSSRDALEVAARENAVSEKSIHELQDLVKKIALKEKIEESREFATDVQKALWSGQAYKNPAVRDRGVRQAPFIVLIGANMPSVLAEISFLSNPTDERRLQSPDYRQKIAEQIYRGIARYASGLSNVKVAQKHPAR
jgi:N-acetylmuramoyl-L-alanine amidase